MGQIKIPVQSCVRCTGIFNYLSDILKDYFTRSA